MVLLRIHLTFKNWQWEKDFHHHHLSVCDLNAEEVGRIHLHNEQLSNDIFDGQQGDDDQEGDDDDDDDEQLSNDIFDKQQGYIMIFDNDDIFDDDDDGHDNDADYVCWFARISIW